MSIGSKLKELIKERKTNVNKLAERAGVAPTTLYSIINRDNTKADIDVLIRIASILGVPVEYFSDNYNPNIEINMVVSESERKLISDFRKLNSDNQDNIKKIVNSLSTSSDATNTSEKEKMQSVS